MESQIAFLGNSPEISGEFHRNGKRGDFIPQKGKRQSVAKWRSGE